MSGILIAGSLGFTVTYQMVDFAVFGGESEGFTPDADFISAPDGSVANQADPGLIRVSAPPTDPWSDDPGED